MHFLLPLLLVACNASLGNSSEDDGGIFVLRTYDVPEGAEPRVEEVLNRVFWRGDQAPLAGRAHQGAPGQIIVAAPASAQDEVEAVIAEFAKVETSAAAARNVTLSYWMVGGRRAPASDASGLPPAIAERMSKVATQELPMRFELIFHESLVSLDGAHARAGGGNFHIEQVASLSPAGAVVAEVDIAIDGGVGTQTRIQLQPGQVLVLGQTGKPTQGDFDAIFYLVRPEITPAE